MSWKLFDYVNSKKENEIKEWTRNLEKRQIGQLNSKLDRLKDHGKDLLPNLLTPTKLTPILEIAIKGNVALRPLLCEGPTKDSNGHYNKEFTILFGAIEKDRKYKPKGALERAKKYRDEVIKDPKNKRCLHERIEP